MLSANYFVFGKQWRFNVPTVLTIDTRNVTSGGTTSSQFRLPYSGNIDALVDWGDESKTRVTNSATATHTYATPGIYDIKIYSSNDSYSLLFYNSLEQLKLVEIKQFGKLLIISNSFRGCSNLTLSQVSDVPNLSTDLSRVFIDCKSLTTINKVNDWNVLNVTDMNNMFNNCSAFNQNLNEWNVSKVIALNSMFDNCTSFNQPLNNWNVSNVTNMGSMFRNCTAFNQNIGSWNTSNVTSMGSMFTSCSAFNQPLNNWNVLNVTNMSNMFRNCTAFNQPLNNWNVSKVTDMNNMFNNCSAFNQNLNDWNVLNVTNMSNLMTGKSSANYNATYYDGLLIALDNSGRTNIALGMGSIKYTSAGTTSRANLITKGWTITDWGLI